jgi:hypothetical protein
VDVYLQWTVNAFVLECRYTRITRTHLKTE